MKELGVWEPYSVKAQTYKTAIEVCILTVQIYCEFLRGHLFINSNAFTFNAFVLYLEMFM